MASLTLNRLPRTTPAFSSEEQAMAEIRFDGKVVLPKGAAKEAEATA